MKQQAERFLEKQNNCFQITKKCYCNKIMSQVKLNLQFLITCINLHDKIWRKIQWIGPFGRPALVRIV